MTEFTNPFQVSIPIVGITHGHETTYKVGTVARVYANGNFLIDWDGETKSDPQQWRPTLGVTPTASKTGQDGRSGGWRTRVVVYVLDEARAAKIDHYKRAVRIRERLVKAQASVAALTVSPESVSDAALKDMLRIINVIESAVAV